MSLDTGRYQLYSTWKSLQERWLDTERTWRDGVRKEFEEKYWAALEPAVKSILIAIDRLASNLVQARQECS